MKGEGRKEKHTRDGTKKSKINRGKKRHISFIKFDLLCYLMLDDT